MDFLTSGSQMIVPGTKSVFNILILGYVRLSIEGLELSHRVRDRSPQGCSQMIDLELLYSIYFNKLILGYVRLSKEGLELSHRVKDRSPQGCSQRIDFELLYSIYFNKLMLG